MKYPRTRRTLNSCLLIIQGPKEGEETCRAAPSERKSRAIFWRRRREGGGTLAATRIKRQFPLCAEKRKNEEKERSVAIGVQKKAKDVATWAEKGPAKDRGRNRVENWEKGGIMAFCDKLRGRGRKGQLRISYWGGRKGAACALKTDERSEKRRQYLIELREVIGIVSLPFDERKKEAFFSGSGGKGDIGAPHNEDHLLMSPTNPYNRKGGGLPAVRIVKERGNSELPGKTSFFGEKRERAISLSQINDQQREPAIPGQRERKKNVTYFNSSGRNEELL